MKKKLSIHDYTAVCLEPLKEFSKEQLLEEIENLLLCLAERGVDLNELYVYYKNGGMRKYYRDINKDKIRILNENFTKNLDNEKFN